MNRADQAEQRVMTEVRLSMRPFALLLLEN